jgi:hypothetical protein
MQPLETLSTTDEVIDALGGNAECARRIGYAAKTVSAWRAWLRGRFPAETYVVLQDELRKAGKTAPATLWNMAEPVRSSPASDIRETV